MKSFAAVAMNSMHYVLEHKPAVKFGVILSTDEEQGSKSTHAFMARYPELNVGVVLDNDVGDIGVISTNAKTRVFVRLTAEGVPAHGSTPWDGLDANEITMDDCRAQAGYVFDVAACRIPGLIPCMRRASAAAMFQHHFRAGGGAVGYPLTEHQRLKFGKKSAGSVRSGRQLIIPTSTPVVMGEDNPRFIKARTVGTMITGRKIVFEQIGGATDARLFAEKGATVIMHSGTRRGHACRRRICGLAVGRRAGTDSD